MARESKAKRDEKRYGNPELMIDLASDPSRWEQSKLTADYAKSREGHSALSRMRDKETEGLSKCIPIVADNVCEYLFAQNPQDVWLATRDYPCCSPPFPNFFVEFARPSRMFINGKISSSSLLPPRWGWHFRSQEILEGQIRTGWLYGASLYLKSPSGNALPVVAVLSLTINANGIPTSEPKFVFPGGNTIAEADRQEWVDTFNILSFPALLAISFMNCKNVTTTGVDPERAINRERRKAGLKPFLRYHTINIEPLKRVLKTEGNIETEGLKKALHICRGHFATYSEDKPLFGHFTGTVWKPAHVRGSAKQGVVVSDYNVKAPGV